MIRAFCHGAFPMVEAMMALVLVDHALRQRGQVGDGWMTEREWDASGYDSARSFVWERGRGVVELLDPQPGERILDLGCGTGPPDGPDRGVGLRAEVVGHRLVRGDMCQRSHREKTTAHPLRGGPTLDRCPLKTSSTPFLHAVLHWVRPPEAVVEVCGPFAKAERPIRGGVRSENKHPGHHDRRG